MRVVIDMQGAQTESRHRGIGRYTLSCTEAILRNRENHEVILALSNLFPETIEPIRAAFDHLISQDNIRVWQAPGPLRETNPGNETRREIAELIREAFLAKLSPDIVHISSVFEGFLDDAVTSIGRLDQVTPVSVSLYDLIPLLNAEHYLAPNPEYAQYYQRKLATLRRADIYLAISESTREESLSHLETDPHRIVNISTAADPQFKPIELDAFTAERLKIKFDLQRPFILYTGCADRRKNLPRLIEAYSLLSPNLRADYQLFLAGNMSIGELANLQRNANTAGLSPRDIRIAGYISDEELVQLYNLCSLFVFPSWHEGFGLPALEAMSCGAPVIGSRTSSIPEVIGFEEALFDPFNVSSMTAKITEVLEDESLRLRLKANGLTRATHFTWDRSARAAISAWEKFVSPNRSHTQKHESPQRKPRLAFVSPLPPARTGIADYSADLLPELARHYDIQLVTDQDDVDESLVRKFGYPRDLAWLRRNADQVDRVLYQFGNSPFHSGMFPLLKDVPGTVVLHDFYLSSVLQWQELFTNLPQPWTNAIYQSHGYRAVAERFRDPELAKLTYPANFEVIQHARGVIVHSEYAKQLGRQWYGEDFTGTWRVIPLARVPIDFPDTSKARSSLGLPADDFVVCSFGFLDSTKLNHRLFSAWLKSKLGQAEGCRLIFVGLNNGGDYGLALIRSIDESGIANRVQITGYVPPEVYRQFLCSADLAVQLRSDTRGESSASVLDCMNHGIPLIVNAHGSLAELSHSAAWILEDDFKDGDLISALEKLWEDGDLRNRLSQHARREILDRHLPSDCASRYMQAIECSYQSAGCHTSDLIDGIANVVQSARKDFDLSATASCVAAAFPLPRSAKRFYLDITETSRSDRMTGIERVAWSLTLSLIKNPPAGYRIEPIYLTNVKGYYEYRFATTSTLRSMDLPVDWVDDSPVDFRYDDILLGLDLSGDTLVQADRSGLLSQIRNLGVLVYFVVFDLLPIRMPEAFPPGAAISHADWLRVVTNMDGAICISKTVADDLIEWLQETQPEQIEHRPFRIAWSHLGADLTSVHTCNKNVKEDQHLEQVLGQLEGLIVFVIVGTIEPRKGHLQTLAAFDVLWKANREVALIIIGREGWKQVPADMRRTIPEIVERINRHPELGRRLFWFSEVSDSLLEKFYKSADCLIAPSEGEGFGLPLIEAARHRLSIIARDLPIFREVAEDNAFYFVGCDPVQLAESIDHWIQRYKLKDHPTSKGLSWRSWDDCAVALLSILREPQWHFIHVYPAGRALARSRHLTLVNAARKKMIASLLPPAQVILDLGGAHCPLNLMGYSHDFKRLYLIDLPQDIRHEAFKDDPVGSLASSASKSRVIVRYGDMTVLDDFSSESINLVWSGQSIEHVSRDRARIMCKSVFRVLKPGGFFCLDTPNRLLTRIHTRESGQRYIHPDHRIEYYPYELAQLLEGCGFQIDLALGICEMPNTCATGHFHYEDFIYGSQITESIDRGYIQFLRCIKPNPNRAIA